MARGEAQHREGPEHLRTLYRSLWTLEPASRAFTDACGALQGGPGGPQRSERFGSRSLKAKPRQSLGCEMFVGINSCEGKEGEAGLDRGRSQR